MKALGSPFLDEPLSRVSLIWICSRPSSVGFSPPTTVRTQLWSSRQDLLNIDRVGGQPPSFFGARTRRQELWSMPQLD